MNALLEIWRLLDVRQRRRFAVLQFVSVIMAFSTLGGIAALLPFLMVLADPQLVDQNAVLSHFFRTLGFESRETFVLALGATFVTAVIVANLVNLFGALAMTRFALGVGDRFHGALLDEYLHRDYLFHARTGSAALYNKVVYATNRVASGLIESGMIFITNAVAILLIVASIVVVNPRIAALAVAWLGGTYLIVYALARRKLYRNGLIETGLIAARSRLANESLDAIREVQVLGRQAFFRDAFERTCRSISTLVSSNQAIANSPRYALECITVAGLVGAALYVSRGRDVAFWLAELTFLGFAAYRLLPAVQQIFVSVVRIRANRAMFDEVAADLRQALHGRRSSAHATTGTELSRGACHELRFENVWFSYAPDNPPALSGVTLRIPAGAMVGFVGPNGSGKTTLIEIALALLSPEHGRFMVDGIVVGAGNRDAWQSTLAYVPQNVVVLDATLAENIALGVPAAEIDIQRLEQAARRAQLGSLVQLLPQGLHAPVGEGGQRLSGGQRQRLGIARALYREATLLVLDEATSSLDGLTELEIIELLRELRGGCTILLVAHRLNVVRECDTIFELEGGALVASGTYEEMLRASPRFRRMAGQDDNLSASRAQGA
jgi:ATP-binding cassette, subfamily B, bacterial PglK